MKDKLLVPCSYQGGKQRISSQVVDELLAAANSPDSLFFDLCCGSGAISIELVNRGVHPSQIVMLDNSSWGAFWNAIGNGSFDMAVLDEQLDALPSEKREIKQYMQQLAALPINNHEAEIYPLLQACSFGGKQIWREDNKWRNAFFRDYWEPTENSIRRSPANPMQPNPIEFRRRIENLLAGMEGITCLPVDIFEILKQKIPSNSVVYVDPPYSGTTSYGFGFSIQEFVSEFRQVSDATLFVSEGSPLAADSLQLSFGGANGGISGIRKTKHQEWLTKFL